MSNTIAETIDADDRENTSHENTYGNETKEKQEDRFRRYRAGMKPF